nr:hypothetical protein [Tanacetum cinerariifolium]
MSSQSESYTSTLSTWKSAVVFIVKASGPKSILSPVSAKIHLSTLDLTNSLVDCRMMGNLKQDLLMIVKKQLVLKMLVDESLEMIVDESLDMIEDESLEMIVDESLDMIEDESVDMIVD